MEIGVHLLVGFNGTTLDGELKALIRDFKVGGIVLFRRNVESAGQLKALLDETQAYAKERLGRFLWVAVDQEGGPVQRLSQHFTPLPSARDLALEGPQAIAEWTAKCARDLNHLGIQINLAPVLDVVSPENPNFMEARSLGSDPQRVCELGSVWIEALQKNGVSATAKHYPGLGQATLDPHHFAPVIRWSGADAMERDLLPFREAVKQGIHCFMTSHALYPDLDPEWPATLSPAVNRTLLRDRLKFEGVLLSDDMDMAAMCEKYSYGQMVRQGIQATIDFFLLCQRSENIEPFYRAFVDTVRGDASLQALIRESRARIEKLYGLHA
ncbi:MAG: glycoside hydrolase family 3 N-terminal domain-containing protein [Acidobacteriota bacterium]